MSCETVSMPLINRRICLNETAPCVLLPRTSWVGPFVLKLSQVIHRPKLPVNVFTPSCHWLLFSPTAAETPCRPTQWPLLVGEQVAEAQAVGELHQRLPVLVVGLDSAFSPTPFGVSIGLRAASADFRPLTGTSNTPFACSKDAVHADGAHSVVRAARRERGVAGYGGREQVEGIGGVRFGSGEDGDHGFRPPEMRLHAPYGGRRG